jgi:hypothetical protein
MLTFPQYKLGTVEPEPEEESDAEANSPCCPVCGNPMQLIEIVPPGGFDRRSEFSFVERQSRAP